MNNFDLDQPTTVLFILGAIEILIFVMNGHLVWLIVGLIVMAIASLLAKYYKPNR